MTLYDCPPGDISVSFEFFPPKTEKMEAQLWDAITRLAPLSPSFVSVTYGAGGSTRERTHATVARLVRETDLVPAAHLTCVGASKDEIAEVAQQYWDAGVRHIVSLLTDAMEKNIAIVTTSTLLAVMRTVGHLWKQEKQTRSVQEIARLSGLLYDQFVAFVDDLRLVGQRMDAARHDVVLAVTSHLPHLIAFNIVAMAEDLESVTESEVVKYSASGFRDFTRIAASDPTMWRDVFLNNRDAVLEVLGRFSEDLSRLQRAIRWGEGDVLFDLFTTTRAIRRSVIEAGQDTPAPNFGRDSKKPK